MCGYVALASWSDRPKFWTSRMSAFILFLTFSWFPLIRDEEIYAYLYAGRRLKTLRSPSFLKLMENTEIGKEIGISTQEASGWGIPVKVKFLSGYRGVMSPFAWIFIYTKLREKLGVRERGVWGLFISRIQGQGSGLFYLEQIFLWVVAEGTLSFFQWVVISCF